MKLKLWEEEIFQHYFFYPTSGAVMYFYSQIEEVEISFVQEKLYLRNGKVKNPS